MMRNFFTSCLLLLLAGPCLTAQDVLQQAVDAFASHPDLAGAKISISVIDIPGNRLVASYRPSDLLTPASSLKTLTTATALIVLGKDYRFPTELQYDGSIDLAGVLHGNLYIKGFGDPTLGSDQMEEAFTLEMVMDEFLQAVRRAGIRQIEGCVIGDDSYFSAPPAPATWKEEDVGNYYGAGVWALNIHENLFYLPFKQSSRLGSTPAILDVYPPIPNLTFINKVKTAGKGTGDNAYIWGGPYDYSREIDGTIPLGSGTFKVKGSIPDPPLVAAQMLTKTLETAGILVDHGATTQDQETSKAGKRTTLLRLYSPTLDKIIARANTESINLYCEALLKAIGQKKYSQGTWSAGVKAVKEVWDDRSLNLDGMNMVDGSGLSTQNALSSYQLAQLMRKMDKDPNLRTVFLASLPVSGESGTLKPLLRGTLAEGRIRAKTGSMRGVRSYTGYATAPDGGYRAFSIIVNGYTCSNSDLWKKTESLLIAFCK